MGVGGCEMKTIGYTCRAVVLTVFGPGFNSRRLHQPEPLGRLTEGLASFGRTIFSTQPPPSGVAAPVPPRPYPRPRQHQDEPLDGVSRRRVVLEQNAVGAHLRLRPPATLALSSRFSVVSTAGHARSNRAALGGHGDLILP